MRVLLLVAMVLAVPATYAQSTGHASPPEPFRHLTDAELEAKVAGSAALVLTTLSDHENYYVLAAGRSGPGEVEAHEHWIDYMVIQHGEAEFTYGGAVTGAHETSKGELRGGSITGGRTITLRAGDFLMVPAGQPHLTMIKPGTPFRAIVFKTRD